MAYTPPAGNEILLDLIDAYSPPISNEIILEFVEAVGEETLVTVVSTVVVDEYREEPIVTAACGLAGEEVQAYTPEEQGLVATAAVTEEDIWVEIRQVTATVITIGEDGGAQTEWTELIAVCIITPEENREEGLVQIVASCFSHTEIYEEQLVTGASDVAEQDYFLQEESLTIVSDVTGEDYFYEELLVTIAAVITETDVTGVAFEQPSLTIVAVITGEDGIVPVPEAPIVYVMSEAYVEDLWHQMDLATVVNTSVVMGEDSANFKEEQQYIAIAIIKSTLNDAFAPAIKGRSPKSDETVVGLSRKVSFYVCGTMGDGVDIDEVKVKINSTLYEKGDPEFSYSGSASQYYVEVDHPAWSYLQGVDVEIDAKSLNGVSMSKVSYSFTTEWSNSLTVGGNANIELYEANNYNFDILTLEEDWVRQGVERYTPELEAWWGRYQKLPFIENLQLRVRAGVTNARGKEILDNGWLSVKVGNGSFVQMYSDTMIDLGPMFTHTKRSIFFKLMVPETAATKKYFVLELEFEPQMYFPYARFRYSNGTYMNGGNMIKLVPNQHVYRAYVFDRDMWQDIIDLGIISSPFYRGEDKKW